MTERIIAELSEERLPKQSKYEAFNLLPLGVAVYIGNELVFRNTSLEVLEKSLGPTRADKLYEAITRPYYHTDAGELSRLEAARAGREIDPIKIDLDTQKGLSFELRIFPALQPDEENPPETIVLVNNTTRQQTWDIRLITLMLQTATHASKTPITVIKAFADNGLDRLSESIDPDKIMCRILEGILRNSCNATNRLNRAIEEIEHSGNLTIETLAIADILKAVRKDMRDSFKLGNIKARFKLPNPDLLIKGNEITLYSLFGDVVSNANRAMKGCEIRNLTLYCRVEDDMIHIYFEDTGIGIPEENQPRIFKKGFTTTLDGSGFGLYSACEIAELHGGKVRLLNTVTQEDLSKTPDLGHTGTVMVVDLPRAQKNS